MWICGLLSPLYLNAVLEMIIISLTNKLELLYVTCKNAFFLVQGLGCNRIRSLLRNGCLIPCNNNYNRLPWFLFFCGNVIRVFVCIFKCHCRLCRDAVFNYNLFPRSLFVEMSYEFLCVKLSVTVDYIEMQVYGVALDDVDFVLFV